MLVTLQPPTPFDQSILWRIHDAYFAARGIDAWNQGEVPYYSTSNYATARQHAGFLTDLVMSQIAEGRLDDDAEIWVLEVGAGLGRFAANFLRALEVASGPLGADLFERIRYVISDYSEKSLREALATSGLKHHVKAGRVLPALFDLREPDRLRLLDTDSDNHPRDANPGVGAAAFQLAIANYVCCVVPLKNMQHRESSGWHEQWVKLDTTLEDGVARPAGEILEDMLANPTREGMVKKLGIHLEWRERPLDLVYPNELHQKVLTELVSDLGDATVGYPHGFIEFVDTVARFLGPGGVVMVNDYGAIDKKDLKGLSERRSQIYGNSIANSINFAVFDAFAAVSGWHHLRTKDPLDSLHTALLRPGLPFSDRELQGFYRNYVQWRGGDDILDFTHTARLFAEKKDWERALRYWKRCIELEPENPDHYYRAGDAAIDGGHYELAVRYLEQGLELQTPEQVLDFEFQLGRATCLAQDYKASIGWYERALLKENHPTTWTNLGVLYESDGRLPDAFRCYRRAMEIDPKYNRARERMRLLKDIVWRKKLEEFEGPGVKDPLADDEDPNPNEGAPDDATPEDADSDDTDTSSDEDNDSEDTEDNDETESEDTEDSESDDSDNPDD
jgi:tetratricopeptide (TPR) repeat protein